MPSLRLLLLTVTTLISLALFGQTSLPLHTIVTEDFNAMGSSATASLPANWRLSPTGNAVGAWTAGVSATTHSANSGLPSTGGRYNWGTTAGTDRAVGFLTSGSYAAPNAVMAFYRNTTGATVNAVTVSFAVERYIVNSGTFTLSFASSTDGSTWTSHSGGDIGLSDFPGGANAASFAAPRIITKTITVPLTVANNGDIYFRWVFQTTNTNSQGIGLDQVSVFAGTPTPVLMATLDDILQTDGGVPGQFNEGDVIRYKTIIKNTGTADAQNVQINIPPPSNTTLVAGSIKTSAVAVDDSYTTSFNTSLSGSTVLANDFGLPAPNAVISYGRTSDAASTSPGTPGVSDAGGTLTLQTNGTFTYTPPSGFSGKDYFKYITGNGNLPNNDAIVTITVAPDISFSTSTVDPSCNNGTNGSITFTASGGNGALQYSITGAAGTFQASNVFSGLPAGSYNLAVKDAGGYIKTGTGIINNPAVIAVSGSIPALTYGTAMSSATFTKTGGTGAVTWSATGLPTGVTIHATTGVASGTPAQTGTFNAVITATDANGCTGSRNVSFTVAPNLAPDTYTGIVGNTQLVANGHSTPSTPFTASAVNILANDASNAAITVTAVTDALTTAGGRITISSDGKFIYTPGAGSTVADSYTYTATSNGVSATATISLTPTGMVWYVNNSYAGANGTSLGTSNRPFTTVNAAATASAVNQIIYVHTGSGNTTGAAVLKSGQTLRGAGTALTTGALSIPAGTKPTLSGTITLANSVTVDGFDMNTGAGVAITGTGATSVTVSVGNITTSAAANAVALTNITGNVTIAGGTQTNSSAASFLISGGSVNLTYSGSVTQGVNAPLVQVSAGHSGTVIFNTGTLSATNGAGLQFDNADGSYQFNGTTTLNGGDAGVDILNGSGGSFAFSSATSITNPTNQVIQIDASTVTFTYAGSFSKSGTASGITITNNTGTNNISFSGSGTKTLSTQTANAISITGNSAATTVSFSGNNLTLTTTTGTGFNATGTGNVSIAGTGNHITAGTGRAVNIDGVTIVSPGITLQDVSATGAATNTIHLRNAGSGGFTISGTGTTAGSGGTINHVTAGTVDESYSISTHSFSPNAFATGIGIYLNNTNNISLSNMNFTGAFGNFAIRGDAVNNFTLRECNFTGVYGTSNNGAVQEGVIRFGVQSDDGFGNGLTGTAQFIGNNIAGGYTDNVAIYNNNTGSLNISFADGSARQAVFGNNGTATGNDAILIETRGNGGAKGAGFNLTFSATGVDFNGARGDLLQTIATSNSTHQLTITNNNFKNMHPNIVSGGGGITLSGGSNVSNIVVNYNITGNVFTGAVGSAIAVALGGQGGDINGIILNNTVGTPNGVYNTAQNLRGTGAGGIGIYVATEKFSGSGILKHAVRIEGNSVTDITDAISGIYLRSNNQGGGTGLLEATVKNNIVKEQGGTAQYAAFYSVVGGASLSDIGIMGLNLTGNTFDNTPGSPGAFAENAVVIDQVAGTAKYYLPGYAGSANGEAWGGTAGADLSTFLQNASHLNILTNGNTPTRPGKVFADAVKGVAGTAFTLPVPLMAAVPAPALTSVPESNILNASVIEAMRSAAIRRWADAGATPEQLEAMNAVDIRIEDFKGSFVGSSEKGKITLDTDGGGHGWFFDPTPGQDEELSGVNSLHSGCGSMPEGRMDLLTVLLHELGHQIGMEDSYQYTGSTDLMFGFLKPGERRIPAARSVTDQTPETAEAMHPRIQPDTTFLKLIKNISCNIAY